MAIGEDRVRVSFNPSQDSFVDRLKAKSAELINDCANGFDETTNPETRRLWSLAMTAIEEGAMWAVKAATAK